MAYRRTSLIKKWKRPERLTEDPTTFNRIIAISGLISNILLGMATVALTIVGITITRQFNAWQQSNATAQDSAQVKRDLAVNASVLKDRCVRIADVGTKIAMGHTASAALRILQTVELLEPSCPRNVSTILRQPDCEIRLACRSFGLAG